MEDYLIRSEEELKKLGYDPRGRGYVANMRSSPWRGKLNFDYMSPLLIVGSVPVFEEDVKQMELLGVDAVVDMCLDNEHEGKMLAQSEIEHFPEFVPDTKPPSQDQLDRVTAWIDGFIKKGKKVYIHCHAGRGRAPTVACAYLITQGKSPQEAFDHVYKHRVSTGVQVSKRQHDALLAFHVRRQNKEK